MNRFDIRLPVRRSATARLAGLTAAGLIATAAIAGCGTGQVAQTTDQASAVNGTEGMIGEIALRNVRIQALQTTDFVPAGSTVDLSFVLANQPTGTDDELSGISTDIGKVSLTGVKKLPAGGRLIVHRPVTPGPGAPSPKQLRAVEDANTATATVALDKPISNGLNYEFTFDFKTAGPITLAVPISAEGMDEAAVPEPQR